MNGVCSPGGQQSAVSSVGVGGGVSAPAAAGVATAGGSAGGVANTAAATAPSCAPSISSALSDRTGSIGGSLTGRTTRLVDVPRRSRSQGTRKLHKCLSTASYSEDGHSSLQSQASNQRQLLVARQYCSFGSTLTNSANYYFYYYFNYCIYLTDYLLDVVLSEQVDCRDVRTYAGSTKFENTTITILFKRDRKQKVSKQLRVTSMQIK